MNHIGRCGHQCGATRTLSKVKLFAALRRIRVAWQALGSGEAALAKYHVYGVDLNGSIVGERWLSASCDDEAVSAVRDLRRQYECQIWKFDRRIARVPAWTPELD